jgi:hypothetical protein
MDQHTIMFELDIHTVQKKNDNTSVLLCHFCNFRGSCFILVDKLKPCSNTIITFVYFRRRNEYECFFEKRPLSRNLACEGHDNRW